MSKTCIITSTNRSGSCASTSVMVHCRNALTLHRELACDLVEGEHDAWKLDQPYDHVICSYASPYIPWKAYIDKVMAQPQARLWWMVNDHDIEDNMLLRHILKRTGLKRTYGVICNNSRKGYRQWILRKWMERDKVRLNDCIDEWHTINLNALTFEPVMETDANGDMFNESYPAIYWGSWRKWRLPYFQRYADPRIVFSTSIKNQKKLKANGCEYAFIPPLEWGSHSILFRCNATVYLEDPHTHTNFAFPANRFYEALSYGVAVLFDKSTRQNAERFGYNGIEYIDSAHEFRSLAAVKKRINPQWIKRANSERSAALKAIKKILT